MKEKPAGDSGDVIVFETAFLYEAEMVFSELRKAGIGAYKREELSSGVEFAMPATAGQGLGVFFIIKVPSAQATKARKVIRRLPVTKEARPDIHDFDRGGRKFWTWYARLSITVVIAWLLLMLRSSMH